MSDQEADVVMRHLRAFAENLEAIGIERETIAATALGWGMAEAVALHRSPELAASFRRTDERIEAGDPMLAPSAGRA